MKTGIVGGVHRKMRSIFLLLATVSSILLASPALGDSGEASCVDAAREPAAAFDNVVRSATQIAAITQCGKEISAALADFEKNGFFSMDVDETKLCLCGALTGGKAAFREFKDTLRHPWQTLKGSVLFFRDFKKNARAIREYLESKHEDYRQLPPAAQMAVRCQTYVYVAGGVGLPLASVNALKGAVLAVRTARAAAPVAAMGSAAKPGQLGADVPAPAAPPAPVKVGKKLDQSTVLAYKSALDTDAFEVKGVRAGAHGGNRVVVERKFGWADLRKDFSSTGADYTQDLRLFPELLGKKGARFFGYEILNKKQATLPDIGEINGAIRRFNSGLPENDPRRIEVSFYSTQDSFVSAEQYVRRFADHGQLPMASSGRQSYHDATTHALQGMTVPNSVVTAYRARSKLWLEFADSIKKSESSPDELNALKIADDKAIDALTDQIDKMGMGVGDLLPHTTKTQFREVGKEYWRDAVKKQNGKLADYGDFNPDLGVAPGMSNYHLQAISKPPREFFGEFITDPALRKRFDAFIDAQALSHPERLKPLPFDLEKTVKRTSDMKWDQLVRKSPFPQKELSESPLYAPFYQRLEYLNRISD